MHQKVVYILRNLVAQLKWGKKFLFCKNLNNLTQIEGIHIMIETLKFESLLNVFGLWSNQIIEKIIRIQKDTQHQGTQTRRRNLFREANNIF